MDLVAASADSFTSRFLGASPILQHANTVQRYVRVDLVMWVCRPSKKLENVIFGTRVTTHHTGSQSRRIELATEGH